MGVMDLRRRIMLNEPHIVTTTPAGIANFSTDLIAPLKSCKVEFSPVQAGTGDPSPENVRPISGWTGCNVSRTGKNLIDKTKYVSYANAKRFIAYGVNNWSDVTPNGDLALGIGSYTISLSGDNTVNPASISVYNSAWERIKIVYSNKIVNFSVTMPGAHAIYINFVDAVPFDSYDVQLELGSTATPYEPYTGSTIPIDWTTEAGTVYGGYVDLVSGELVAEWASVVFDGSFDPGRTNWRMYNDSSAWLYTPAATPGIKNVEGAITILSDKLETILYDKLYVGDIGITLVGSQWWAVAMRVPVAGLSDNASVNAWLSENPITLIYELATPITYQLTPVQLKSLRGVNNIWADANGNIEAKYWTH